MYRLAWDFQNLMVLHEKTLGQLSKPPKACVKNFSSNAYTLPLCHFDQFSVNSAIYKSHWCSGLGGLFSTAV